MTFAVAIGEGQTAARIVQDPGKILKLVERGIAGAVAGHVGEKVAPINGLWILVNKHEGLGWPGTGELGGFEKNAIRVDRGPPAGSPSESPEIQIHGDAADARLGNAADHHKRRIGRAAIKCRVAARVRPERTLSEVDRDVPICPVIRAGIQMRPRPGELVLRISRSGAVIARIDNSITIVIRVHSPGVAHLAVVVQALEGARTRRRAGQRREQAKRQQRQHADNEHQVQQGERNAPTQSRFCVVRVNSADRLNFLAS